MYIYLFPILHLTELNEGRIVMVRTLLLERKERKIENSCHCSLANLAKLSTSSIYKIYVFLLQGQLVCHSSSGTSEEPIVVGVVELLSPLGSCTLSSTPSLPLGITAIIFVVACSNFDMVIGEDPYTVSCNNLLCLHM